MVEEARHLMITNPGAFAVALLWVWVLAVSLFGMTILAYRAWCYRRDDRNFSLRFMAILWAVSLSVLAAWATLVWLDMAIDVIAVVPDQPDRWMPSGIIALFVAVATGYSLVVWFQNERIYRTRSTDQPTERTDQ